MAAGAPGAVDIDRGIVTVAPNLKGWIDVPMRDILHGALGAPVLVENDVNLALLGEHWRAPRAAMTRARSSSSAPASARPSSSTARCTAATTTWQARSRSCAWGRSISITITERAAAWRRWPGWRRWRRAGRARASAILNSGSRSCSRPRRTATAKARKAIDETARLLGIAAANVGTVVDPSLIVLGGALFAQAEPLVAEVRQVVERIARAPVDLVVSALGKEAPLAGCVLVAATEARRQVRLRLRKLRRAGAESTFLISSI